MTPRSYLSVPALNGGTIHAPWRRRLAVFSICVLALILSSILYNHAATSDGTGTERHVLPQACLPWHQAAGAAVSRLAQSTRDADLRQIGDSVFRMRRARRNCEAGWLELACQDYYAVATGAASLGRAKSPLRCSRDAEFPNDRG